MVSEQLDEEAIFQTARRIDSSAARMEYLHKVCGNDQKLLVRVMTLLRTFIEDDSFLESPPPGIDGTIQLSALSEGPGTIIGFYKLLEQIGEGGFGVVFLAEQEQPVRRKVALKVIKPGMDTRQVIARFEAERQALAMMDHPNIAKVHDAGATENGRPYFVMELVQGVPITEYCDQCNLTTCERLELFITVCQAVQHAHQKGIIHRDLKPTNVLVAMQDGRPAPKIIDFGVAKAIGQRLTEHTLTTAFAQMVGSPLYMSPEQAELSPLGVDTRSDIYSLGVMLYEILAGTTPFDKDRLHAASYDELRRIIREEEPPRPSARISTLAADLATTVAERRRTDARHLRQQIRGELDWIVMKCLEKDRNRRYETPNSLARDIERYLHDEPVQACPPSASYRLKKFVRRNKMASAFVALLLLSVAGLAISNVAIKRERDAKTTALAQATTESARAKVVSDLLQEMLGSADAEQSKGSQYTVRELLDDFSTKLGDHVADPPAVAADIHATIGRAYRSLQVPAKAQPHLERAIKLRRQLDGPQSEKLAAILVDYGWNLQNQGRYFEAESQLRQAVEIYHQLGVTGSPVIHALRVLQHVLIADHRDNDAETVMQEAMTTAGDGGEKFPDLATMLHRYADSKIYRGHPAEAEQLARQSVDMHRRLHGDRHPETAYALKTLASALQEQQKFDEAETALRESLAVFRRCFPEDHFTVRSTVDQLKMVLQARGDQSALDTFAVKEAQVPIGSDGPSEYVRLAGLLLANNAHHNYDEAHRLIQRAIEAYGKVAIDHPEDFDRRRNAAEGYVLGVLRLCASNPEFASEVDEVNRRLTAELPALLDAFPTSSECQWHVALIYRAWAIEIITNNVHLTTTEHAYRESIRILENLAPAFPQPRVVRAHIVNSYVWLTDVLVRTNRLEEAETVFRRAMEINDQLAAEDSVDYIQDVLLLYTRFVHFLATTHRESEADVVLHKAVLAAQRGLDNSASTHFFYVLALVRLQLGDEVGYRETCAALVQAAGMSSDDRARIYIPWTYGLGPHAVDDLSVALKYAEENIARNPLDLPYLNLAVLGAVQYRACQYEQAALSLEKSIAESPSHPPTGFGTALFSKLLLAMTRWQQGQRDEARQLLADIQPAINESFQTPLPIFQHRVLVEVLGREAKALIQPKKADEAVENKGRPGDELKHQPSLEVLAKAARSDSAGYHSRLAGHLLMNNSQGGATSEVAHELVRRAIEDYDRVAIEYPDDLNRRLNAATGFVELNRICSAAPGFSSEVEEVHRRLMLELPQLALIADRLADPNDSANGLYYVAVAQLRLGDKAGYRATCKTLVDIPLGKLEGLNKSRPIWTACIGPDALDDPSLPVKLAEECVANNLLSEPHYGTYMLGAAHYRAGQYEQAAERLKESIAAYPSDPLPGHDSMNYQQLFLAMTKWQQGQKDEARRLLAETLPALDKDLRSPASSWNRRATLEILRREAESMIEPKKTNEAVEKKSRTSDEPEKPER